VLLTAALVPTGVRIPLVREDGMTADPRQRAGMPGTGAAGHVVDRYRRAVGPAVRGAAGVVLAAGFGLEWLVTARTGRRALGRGRPPRAPAGEHAEDR